MSQSSKAAHVARNTFGLINPETGKQYKDILQAHIETAYLSPDFNPEKNVLWDSSDFQYIPLLDAETTKALHSLPMENASLRVIVSFQVRKSGNFAVVRLPKLKSKE